jgi:cytochrome P450
MSDTATRPAHVPEELVRRFAFDFRGPVDDIHPRLDALRGEGRVLWLETGMGVGYGGLARGAWLFTHADDIRAALQAPDMFSSEHHELGDGAEEFIPRMIPIFMDPPDHTKFRRILNPLFSPAVIATMEESIQTRITRLVDGIAPRGECDFVQEIAVQFPTRVFTSWFGLPEEDTDRFVDMVSTQLHGSNDEERMAASAGAMEALATLVGARMAEPTGDLMSQIVRQPVDGRALTFEELMSIAVLLFLAGLDTVAAALSFSFWYLAQSPANRRALATGAVPAPKAVEEMLRRHSFVSPPRRVAHDLEFAGVAMRENDPVIIMLPLASRDPDEYADATSVHLDRDGNRHYAFGAGPHRCVGSHLARLEMRLAFAAWHARIPEYELAGDALGYGGTVMGVSTLPLRWS